MVKKLVRFLLTLLVILLVCAIGAGVYGYRVVTGSLAQLDGTVRVSGLTDSVSIERDAAGIPTIRAKNAVDRAFAIGYLHGQDRFFQMDLLRRVAAGELAELVGKAAIPTDKDHRIHQFRKRATAMIAQASEEDKKLLDVYAGGVNAGLSDLSAKPIEYYVLGADPKSWAPEDSVLCMFSMYLDLQGKDYQLELARHTAYATLPKELADFLTPRGSKEWEAPVDGEPLDNPPLPSPEVINVRDKPLEHVPDPTPAEGFGSIDFGSNNWAVGAARSKHGGAIVADDMHLGLRVPNIWYRASFIVPPNEVGNEKEMTATGVTLPGTPSLVVASNGKIAWAFTNSEGDWVDLVIVEPDPADPERRYLTSDGSREYVTEEETIQVQGGPVEKLAIKQTIWGPVIAKDHEGRPMALRWVAHDLDGANLKSARMYEKQTLEVALDHANICGSPAQNFVVADNQGRIAWTILGRIPRRKHDGWIATSWKDPSVGWDGYLNVEEYPRIFNPEDGRIWTANARVVSGEMLAKVGNGGYDLGARQKQIRDDMKALDKADEKDLLAIQLDDRALFWSHWQKHVVGLLTDDAVASSPKRKEAKEFLEKWGERASVESVGFRIIRNTHLEITRRVLEWLTGPCRKADPSFRTTLLPRGVESSVWTMVSTKPMHLLDPKYLSWDEFVLECLDAVLEEATNGGKPLADFTWGNHNTLAIEHPLSKPVREILGEGNAGAIALDMPRVPVSGGPKNLPKIARPRAGASQRMVVSPGKEDQGIFHMPTGQSGHPLSPFYAAGHQDWVEGNPSPFLPGQPAHTLILEPRRD
jgi:penicillin amidase